MDSAAFLLIYIAPPDGSADLEAERAPSITSKKPVPPASVPEPP